MPEQSDGEPSATPTSSEVVAWAEDGRLVVSGEPAAVDEFLADLKPERELDLAPYTALAAGVGALAGPEAVRTATRYAELGAQRWKEIEGSGATQSELRLVTRNLETGRFVSNQRLAGGALATQPGVLIALAAVEMAIQSLTDAVEEIAEDVDDLKRIAETAEIGNLGGLYRVLATARSQVDRSGSISRATWESIAPHEVTAQQAADRVRALLRRTVEDFPVTEDAAARLSVAQRLVAEGTLRRSLRLLVLAEQCRLLWRSLKLDRVRVSEPAELAAEAEAAEALLAENAHADRELVTALRDGVDALTRTGALDGARFLTRSKLPAAEATLRAHIDEFATTRAQQLESWAPDTSPGLRDAAREVGAIATRALTDGRQAVGGWVSGLGTWIQGAPELEPAEPPPTPSRNPSTTDSRVDPSRQEE